PGPRRSGGAGDRRSQHEPRGAPAAEKHMAITLTDLSAALRMAEQNGWTWLRLDDQTGIEAMTQSDCRRMAAALGRALPTVGEVERDADEALTGSGGINPMRWFAGGRKQVLRELIARLQTVENGAALAQELQGVQMIRHSTTKPMARPDAQRREATP